MRMFRKLKVQDVYLFEEKYARLACSIEKFLSNFNDNIYLFILRPSYLNYDREDLLFRLSVCLAPRKKRNMLELRVLIVEIYFFLQVT